MDVQNLRFSGKSNPEIPIFRKTKSGISDFRKTEIRNFRFSENEIRNFRFSPARVAKYSVFQHLKSGKSESRYYRDTITILSGYFGRYNRNVELMRHQARSCCCSASHDKICDAFGLHSEKLEKVPRIQRARFRRCCGHHPPTNLDFGTQTLTIPFAG